MLLSCRGGGHLLLRHGVGRGRPENEDEPLGKWGIAPLTAYFFVCLGKMRNEPLALGNLGLHDFQTQVG